MWYYGSIVPWLSGRGAAIRICNHDSSLTLRVDIGSTNFSLFSLPDNPAWSDSNFPQHCATASHERPDCQPPEPAIMPFHFLDLPYDIRTIVYRHDPERARRSLLPDGYEIYYEESAVPTALFQACKFITAELKDEIEFRRRTVLVSKTEPITLVGPR
jgi:hypothetical protein